MDEQKDVLELEVNSNPEVAKGVYANLSLAVTNSDVSRLDFIYVDDMAAGPNGKQAAYLVSRVLMSHEQLKSLYDMLGNHLAIAKAE